MQRFRIKTIPSQCSTFDSLPLEWKRRTKGQMEERRRQVEETGFRIVRSRHYHHYMHPVNSIMTVWKNLCQRFRHTELEWHLYLATRMPSCRTHVHLTCWQDWFVNSFGDQIAFTMLRAWHVAEISFSQSERMDVSDWPIRSVRLVRRYS